MRLCLEGLSVGDSFGEKFFVHPDIVDGLIESRGLPSPPWYFTDDTLMAISIPEVLAAPVRLIRMPWRQALRSVMTAAAVTVLQCTGY